MSQARAALLGAALLLAGCGGGAGDRVCAARSSSLAAREAALSCWGDLAGSPRAPVLLVPGTTLDPASNFDWNYLPALRALDWPHCTVELPDQAMGDIAVAAEFVAHGISQAAARSGRRVQVVGYSQGGLVPRWAFKYFPETRAQVEELISLSGSHHGTVIAEPTCLGQGCAPAIWQQSDRSALIAALNEGGETYPEIDYSALYTFFDEVVVPNTPPAPSSALAGGENVVSLALQTVCPANVADHLAIGSYDAVAWALVLDALSHPGPVDPARIDPAVCAQPLMPGVNPQTFAADYLRYLNTVQTTLRESPRVPAEPALPCYAAAS
ncbi:MAG TPA: hypothetical protein VFV27_09170 [Nevskiaceae bacterium]|nr:hypothetical protein [Nevskiaceae bacterium]